MPADWPGQYLPRQLVYQKASQATAASDVSQGSCRHPLTSVVPTLGPLMLMRILCFHICIHETGYETVFPGRKLADKPKHSVFSSSLKSFTHGQKFRSAHAQPYLAVWLPNTQRKFLAEIKQNIKKDLDLKVKVKISG